MKDLIEVIGNYKRVTQSLLNNLDEYLDFVLKNLPKELWIDFGVITIKSQHGAFTSLGIQRQTDRLYEEDASYYYVLIPANISNFGNWEYLHNDFHAKFDYCTSKEAIQFSKELPNRLINLSKKYSELTNEIDELTKII